MQELFPQCQILSIPETPQSFPSSFQPPFLHEKGMQCQPPFLIDPRVRSSPFNPTSIRHRFDYFSHSFEFTSLKWGVKDEGLEIVEFFWREEPIFVGIDQAKDSGQGRDTRGFESVGTSVVEGSGRVENCVLGKEEDFRDVEG